MASLNTLSEQALITLLNEVVVHTFESVFFAETIPQPASEALHLLDANGLEVTIAIDSGVRAGVRMCLSSELAHRLMAMHLKPDAGTMGPDILADAFAEIINTIAGRIAASLQSDQTFDLSIPKVVFGKIAETQSEDITTVFRVEHGLVMLSFHCEHLARGGMHAH